MLRKNRPGHDCSGPERMTIHPNRHIVKLSNFYFSYIFVINYGIYRQDNDMNLKQLNAFQEVMRTGSVTQASANLGCTQPAITNLIHRLESDIGQTLFQRRNRRLLPTPEAHYLMSEAVAILDQVQNVETKMRSAANLKAGELRIACMPIISDLLASQFIADYVSTRPDVRIYLSSQPSHQVYDSLASQQFDIGFAEIETTSPLVDADEITERCVCAINSNHPLARQDVIHLGEIAPHPLAIFLPGNSTRLRLEQAAHDCGANLNIRFEMANTVSRFPLIEAGLAWSLASPLTVNYFEHQWNQLGTSDIVFRQLEPAVAYRTAILTPRHRIPSLLAQDFSGYFSNAIRQVMGSLG